MKTLNLFNEINAKIIKYTNYNNIEIYTYVLIFPRCILSEFNTHRAFSRNSASSRAIPIKKLSEDATFVPENIYAGNKGMSPKSIHKDTEDIQDLIDEYRKNTIVFVNKLADMNVAKEQANRYLEPFTYHKVIMTSGKEGLINFFNQRLALVEGTNIPQADRNMYQLAFKMKEEFDKYILPSIDRYHIPFIKESEKNLDIQTKIELSVTRSAHVSYESVGNNKLIDKDSYKNIFNKLINGKPIHYSPFEHIAYIINEDVELSGNLPKNVIQIRKILEKYNNINNIEEKLKMIIKEKK